MTDQRQEIIDECRRQEESCRFTAATLYEWLKALRWWRQLYVVAPIVLGAVAGSTVLGKWEGWEWVGPLCGLLAGLFPAIYKALNLDRDLKTIACDAHQFIILRDSFRVAANVTALSDMTKLDTEFRGLMKRMDNARSNSLTAPEGYFLKARKKIEKDKHYDFEVDIKRAAGVAETQ